MKTRKTKDIQRVLLKKGFKIHPEKDHHQYYILTIDGKKQSVRTYFSHSLKEYNPYLMNLIKKELKFTDSNKAEQFFDCPMTEEMYIQMLKESNIIK